MREFLPDLVKEGIAWALATREDHRPAGRRLSTSERDSLAGFFSESVLDSVRLRSVHQIENPPFMDRIDWTRMPEKLDFRFTSGITFVDTILITCTRPHGISFLSLLFHECVHVVQYGVFGVNGFIERFITGWAENRFLFQEIPLERQATELAARFENNPERPFSVETAVRALKTVDGIGKTQARPRVSSDRRSIPLTSVCPYSVKRDKAEFP